MSAIASGCSENDFRGTVAVPGLAEGIAHIYEREKFDVSDSDTEHTNEATELERLREAMQAIAKELDMVAAFARQQADDDSSNIIETQKAILEDPELLAQMQFYIQTRKVKADRAVYDAFGIHIRAFRASDSELLRERVTDLRDIRNRLIAHMHKATTIKEIPENAVLVADDISPTEVVLFAKHHVRAFITEQGGLNAHASIVAGALDIPMLINVPQAIKRIAPGQEVWIDAIEGFIYVSPDEQQRSLFQQRNEELNVQRKQWERIKNIPTQTACGTRIDLRANIEFDIELPAIQKDRVNGIGLLRTESFFFDGEEERIAEHSQEQFYENAVENCGSESVTIRLFDVGGDKLLRSGKEEANPFLGWRGIRILLDKRQILRQQLRAILKVAGRHPGQIRILIPMVSDVHEVEEVKHEISEIQNQLQQQDVAVDRNVPVGIMVEVPSVAVMAGSYAQVADFFSIGTNDLTQYTLAVDRGNTKIANLYQQMHPSVWRMIRLTTEAAERYGIPVSVCGELASYAFASLILVAMGIRDLSMAIPHIPDVKHALMTHSLLEMNMLAEEVCQAKSAQEVLRIEQRWKANRKREIPQ